MLFRSPVSREVVEQTAYLARLSFREDEAAQLQTDLGKILGFVAQLGEVDTSGVEPTVHAVPATNHLRPDEPQPSLDRPDVVRSSPDREAAAEGFFAVPAVLGDQESGGEG